MIKNIFADKVIKLKKGAYHNLICPLFLKYGGHAVSLW